MDSELVEEGVGGDKGKEFHALKGEEVPGTEMGYRDEVTVIRKAHRVISHKTERACTLLLSKVFSRLSFSSSVRYLYRSFAR